MLILLPVLHDSKLNILCLLITKENPFRLLEMIVTIKWCITDKTTSNTFVRPSGHTPCASVTLNIYNLHTVSFFPEKTPEGIVLPWYSSWNKLVKQLNCCSGDKLVEKRSFKKGTDVFFFILVWHGIFLAVGMLSHVRLNFSVLDTVSFLIECPSSSSKQTSCIVKKRSFILCQCGISSSMIKN